MVDTQKRTIYETYQILCFVSYLFFLLVACESVKKSNLETYVGLYEIVRADCKVTESSFDPCQSTYFFEIVKGQFSGINNDDLAYVFWSGYPEIDSELQYTAHLIANHATKTIIDRKVWLSKDQNTQEYLVFKNGYLNEYSAEYSGTSSIRKIRYILRPVRRGSQPSYRMNYPGNK